EWPGLGARHRDDADGITFPQHWYKEAAPKANRARHPLMLILRIDLDIGYVDNCAFEDRPTVQKGSRRARRVYTTYRLEGFGRVVVLRDLVHQFAVELIERAEESVAQPHGASDDRVEDGLQVCGRARDHAEDLGRGGLLFVPLRLTLERLREALL